MKFDDLTKEYLQGEKFSNGAIIHLNDTRSTILYRDDYLLQISKNKKILHLGFVDHLPLIDEKIAKGNWLHKKLMDVSETCYGIDINKEGIQYIQDKYDYKDLFALDILTDTIPEVILHTNFDYILIPDVIEHIGNPVDFLSAIRQRFKNNVANIVVTTPNATRYDNVINTFKNVECINTDHRFWFTPYTISKIVIDAGYKINSLDFFEHGRLSRRQFIKKWMITKYPAFKDNIIINISLQ